MFRLITTVSSLAIASTVLLAAATADADILVQYRFEGADDTARRTAEVEATGVDAGLFAEASSFDTSGSADPGASSGTPYWRQNLSGNSAVTKEFTISPDTGYELNITGFDFYAAAQRNSNTLTLRYKIGGAASFTTIGTSSAFNNSNPVSDTEMGLRTIAFDPAALSALSGVTESITFEFTLTNGHPSPGNPRLNDVTIRGTAVPEPASLALMGLGGLCLLGGRRKRMAGD